MSRDEDQIRALSEEYEALKTEHKALLEQLTDLQQRMDAIMLKIIDVTRA